MAAAEGPVAEFSGLANFEKRKRKSNLLMSFPKIVNQMGSFGKKKKKNVFSLLSADCRYFWISALNWLIFLMKRARHFFTKLNARDIQKFNCFGYPLMICSPLFAKQCFPRQRRTAFID